MPLSEVVEINKGSYITKKEVEPGSIPVILGGTEPAYWHSMHNHIGEGIVVSRSGVNAGFASYWDEPIFVSDGFVLDARDAALLRYVFHYLKRIQGQLNSLKRGSGVPHINRQLLGSIPVPIPSLEEQKRIVATLDKFDMFVNDISQGLPAEIEVRRKQYEYYRDRLFTFKKKAA